MTQEQREAVIIQARNLYIKEGIKSVRMDDIAKSAGISKRTLYEVFGDKEELLYLAMTYHFERLFEQHDKIAAGAPNILIAIMKVMESVLETSEVNWKLRNALRRFHPAVNRRIDEEAKESKQPQFRKGLEIGVADGLLNPRANLDLAMTMLQFLSISLVTGNEDFPLPEGMTPQNAFVEIMVTTLRGISTTKGLEEIDNYITNSVNKRIF